MGRGDLHLRPALCLFKIVMNNQQRSSFFIQQQQREVRLGNVEAEMQLTWISLHAAFLLLDF